MEKTLTALLAFALLAGAFTPVLAQEALAPEPEAVETAPESIPTEEVATTTEPSVATTTPEVPIILEVATTSEPQMAEKMLTTELIVKFKEGDIDLDRTSGRREADAITAEVGAVLEERLVEANSAVVSVEDAKEAIETLENDPSVEYAEPNYARSFQAVIPTDPEFANQWALQNTGQTMLGVPGTVDADIDATEAWDLSLGTSTIVAVIDNGVLYAHPDLANNMWDGSACVSDTGAALGGCMHGYDYADNDLEPLPLATSSSDATHGTHVAGIIAAEMGNATGTVGVAPKAKIMALRFGLDVASEVKAIDFAIQNGAKIINASYGGSGFSQAEYDAIVRFRDAGGIFVAAAGNDGTDNDSVPEYPASHGLSNIVSVAATDNVDGLAAFTSPAASNYGAATVDLGAPGRSIRSTTATNGVTPSYANLSGTSMAAPQVAGVLALVRSLYPSATTSALTASVIQTGDALSSLSGKTVSGKRLNALSAVQYLATDILPPVITLIGDSNVSITVGGDYSEPGATATDIHDGAVAVTIGGDAVNTSVAGTYTLTYDAVDLAGNHAVQVTRTVTVAEESRRRSGGGGGGGGGGSRNSDTENPTRSLLTTPATSYASMTPEQRAALLNLLLTLLAELQAKLAAMQAQGL